MRIFTARELAEAKGKPERLAADFSLKESVSKSFGTGIRGFHLSELEILRDELGKPYVVFHGKALDRFRSLKGKSCYVTISDTKELVMTMAVLESE